MSLFKSEQEVKLQRLSKAAFKAAQKGYIHTVQECLDDGLLLETKDRKGRTLLHVAALCEKVEVVNFLIGRNANVNTQDNEGNTILCNMAAHYLCDSFESGYWHSEYLVIANTLLAKKLDINVQNSAGNTALHLSVVKKNNDEYTSDNAFVRFLMNNRANPQIKNKKGETPAAIAAKVKHPYANKLFAYEEEYKASVPPLRIVLIQPAPEPTVTAEAEIPPVPVKVEVEAPKPDKKWVKTGEEEITSIEEKEAIGYRLTEIFNFQTQIYTRILHNTVTQSETPLMREFADFSSKKIIDLAAAAYERETGKPPQSTGNFIKPMLGQ